MFHRSKLTSENDDLTTKYANSQRSLEELQRLHSQCDMQQIQWKSRYHSIQHAHSTCARKIIFWRSLTAIVC